MQNGSMAPEQSPQLSDRELLAQQGALQHEADEVWMDLDLEAFLSPFGQLVRVGSAALGLMVWRDLDITVVCDRLSLRAVTRVGAEIAMHPGVNKLVFRNDTGRWNTDPAYPDGLYLGMNYQSAQGNEWALDVWFVDEPEFQPDLQHLHTMPTMLDESTRLAILRIKAAWAVRPEYGRMVRSIDIYSAVLDGGVRDVDGFGNWLSARARL
jgi:hypothetical protein